MTQKELQEFHEEIKRSAVQYENDVLNGVVATCKYTKQAIVRHRADLEKSENGIFDYAFDPDAGIAPISFIERFCVHVKGELKGSPLKLEPWQRWITYVLFGWLDKYGWRRFNTAFIEVAKKNGKSTWVAGLGLFMLWADGEGGAEVYSAATTKDQAKVVFHEYARAMVVLNPELQEKYKYYAHSIVDRETETSSFKAVSSDVDSLDGKNVHCSIIDEYHAHKTDGVYKIMSDGMSARSQPMTIIITTAGFDPDVPCVDEEDYAKRILAGRAINEAYFAIVYTIDDDDDWKNKDVWVKANPCLGISKQRKAMDRDFKKALDMQSEQSKFKNKNLNVWTKNKTGWIKDDDWTAIEIDFDLSSMAGRECYAAIDLATTIDTASYTLIFPPKEPDEKFRLYTRIFLPDWEIKERQDRERFEWQEMADSGYVILTPGRTIDYDFIQVQLESDLDEFDLREIGYDPWNASQFISNLIKLGIEDKLVEVSQGWKFISPAAKDFEQKVINKELESYRNPVVSWMVSNTMVQKDARGNIRPVKASPNKHIDGTMTCMMALDRAVRNVNGGSVYETRGVLVF